MSEATAETPRPAGVKTLATVVTEEGEVVLTADAPWVPETTTSVTVDLVGDLYFLTDQDGALLALARATDEARDLRSFRLGILSGGDPDEMQLVEDVAVGFA